MVSFMPVSSQLCLITACGYAAFSLMLKNAAVLTMEFKVNLLSPAKGKQFRAVGKV